MPSLEQAEDDYLSKRAREVLDRDEPTVLCRRRWRNWRLATVLDVFAEAEDPPSAAIARISRLFVLSASTRAGDVICAVQWLTWRVWGCDLHW